MKPGNYKFSLGAPNEALAQSLSIQSTLWSLKLGSGLTIVNESNVFGCPEDLKRRSSGGHLGASIHKSIGSNEEMNEFREEVQNESWDPQIQSGTSR